jgi:isocitrate/isopropylmalate dehydrogenase
LSPVEAIFYGAVGWPETVPDHVSLWGSLLQFRRRFEQVEALASERNIDLHAADGDALVALWDEVKAR